MIIDNKLKRNTWGTFEREKKLRIKITRIFVSTRLSALKSQTSLRKARLHRVQQRRVTFQVDDMIYLLENEDNRPDHHQQSEQSVACD